MEWFYLLIVIILWLLLAAIHSIRIEPSEVSDFELRRRAKNNAKSAVAEIERNSRLPGLRALKYLCIAVLWVVLVACNIAFYGFAPGLLIVFLATLLLPLVSQLSFISRRAQVQFDRHEASLIQLSVKWYPVLKWLESRDSVSERRIHSKDEFLYLAEHSHGTFTKDELQLLKEGLAFQGKIVREVMTPHSAIAYAEDSETVGPVVLDRLHKTGHSRFPVVHGDIDHVVGMLYMHEMVPLDKKQKTVKQAMSTEVYYIRDDQSLEHALHAFLRTYASLFIVVNEKRATVGLLSLEDVLEALLGRSVVDEFDAFHDLYAVAETNPRNNNQPKKHEAGV
jgi:CBS domain containing-hemolysin-like protein